MALYLLSAPTLQVSDDDGAPFPGALLYTYAAGTTSPLVTYSDVDGLVPNTNPVEADAGGRFGDIFLTGGVAYKFILVTVDAVTVWTTDNFVVPALSTDADQIADDVVNLIARPIQIDCCDGRLTLTTGVPVTTADVTAATTVYFAPYMGNRIALFDGVSTWSNLAFTQLSVSLAAFAANSAFDCFVYNNSGVATLETLVWTSLTARATALTTQDGVLVKSGQSTRRYVGSFRTTGTIGQTEDSAAKRYVQSYYHRAPKTLQKVETGTDTYTTATWRQAKAGATNQVEIMNGFADQAIDLSVVAAIANTNANVLVGVSIGEDSVTVPATGVIGQAQSSQVANVLIPFSATLKKFPAVGHRTYVWLEISAATGTTTWTYAAGNMLSGISGIWWC